MRRNKLLHAEPDETTAALRRVADKGGITSDRDTLRNLVRWLRDYREKRWKR